jgi:hypothetical protein
MLLKRILQFSSSRFTRSGDVNHSKEVSMRWFLPFVFVFLNSCIIHRVEVTPVELRDQPEITVESPVKAHMKDGSTVVFEDGIRVRDGRV